MIVLPMRRDITRLAEEEFDLLVVGGGIHGAATAWAAARKGLATALIDRGDFGHATSANSLKIIHGGLRYLQQADLGRMRSSILARRELQRLAPHLVRPLPCVTPTSGFGTRNRLAMTAALLVNDLVGRDRNRGLAPEDALPPGKTVSREEMLRLAPGLAAPGVSGGAVWHDCLAENTERLTLAFVMAAAERGACVANYVEAGALARSNGAVTGASATDVFSGNPLSIDAAVTVDAAGPWTADFAGAQLQASQQSLPRRWARAANIFVDRPLTGTHALGLRDERSGQVFFFVPWRGGTMIGTWYSEHPGGEMPPPEREEIERMTADVNRIHPAAGLRQPDVRFSHAGLVPLMPGAPAGAPHLGLETEARVTDYADAGIQGLIGIAGVKYTTACRIGEEAARLATGKLRRDTIKEIPGPLPGKFEGPLPEGAAQLLDSETIRRLETGYGAAAKEIFSSVAAEPALARAMDPAGETLAAEIVHSVRSEMAMRLSDIVLRRTGLGSKGHPGGKVIRACASLAAAELGWSRERKAREIAEVEERFIPYRTGDREEPEALSRERAGPEQQRRRSSCVPPSRVSFPPAPPGRRRVKDPSPSPSPSRPIRPVSTRATPPGRRR
jgi:glycerol-3-phosphate dehydrogenase